VLEPGDYATWKNAWANLPEPANRWTRPKRSGTELTRASYRSLLLQQWRNREADQFYHLAVFQRASGALIGGVSLMDVMRGVSQNAYLGYSIFSPYWRQGFGREAVGALLKIGFEDLKLHRIEAGIEPRNLRSRALARSLGLRHEGCKRRCVHLRGEWVDLAIYSITAEDLGIRFDASGILHAARS
jgi:ribosomal-protein-alanine N-acetyltransferase